MKEHKMSLDHYHIDKSWSLFLDRDGVINRRIIDDYVKTSADFLFLEKVPESIHLLSKVFGRIFIVTNQQGIGKGLMTIHDLKLVHHFLLKEVENAGGKIDQIYFCPELAATNHPDRKPEIGMAQKAKKDFPEIEFSKSIMVGDSFSDMEFGLKAGMKNVFIKSEKIVDNKIKDISEEILDSLYQFTQLIINQQN